MKNGKIGYAVVGLGIGKAHVDAAAAYDRCELIAVCDLIQEKMDKVVGRYPGTLTYTDFDEMMKNPDIDIVSICLPSAMHADYAVKAMEAGKNVLCEKPIDITVEAAEKIEEARVRTGMTSRNRPPEPQQRGHEADKGGCRLRTSWKAGFSGTFAVKWYRDQHLLRQRLARNVGYGRRRFAYESGCSHGRPHAVADGRRRERAFRNGYIRAQDETDGSDGVGDNLQVGRHRDISSARPALIRVSSTDIQLYGTGGTIRGGRRHPEALETEGDSEDEDEEEVGDARKSTAEETASPGREGSDARHRSRVDG